MSDPVGDAQLVYLSKIERHLSTIRSCMVILTFLVAVTIIQAGVIR